MTYVKDLEEEIYRILQSSSQLRKYNSDLRNKYIKQEENFDRERKGWDRGRKKWSKKLGEVVTENQNLQFEKRKGRLSDVSCTRYPSYFFLQGKKSEKIIKEIEE
ncbi:8672_t:CDS:1 [Paraglomus brasilianum]|uniref:8672_t:CDS:1 n=1 Tax=Paraglomus brasilianum TaxID=144538 RepID=A0A9N9GS40_9GLOM|nr:8672_t:CDS:1 [Paraglomus brasilianum]